MHQKHGQEKSSLIGEHLNSRRNQSDFDKKMLAGSLVKEIHSVNVDEAYRKISKRIQGRHQINRSISWFSRAAAILILPLLAFSIWSLSIKNKEEKIADNNISWQEIQSPLGIRSHILLPDGTDLWLNAGSKIRYCIPFVREKRQLELSGEAFLHVARNENAPFLVNTEYTSIQVLGTQFNVKAYPEDEQIEVTLKEGSVEFSCATSDTKEFSTLMVPNDHLTFWKKDGHITKENIAIDKYIAWTQNKMIFDHTPLTELVKYVERWYGVNIIILDEEIRQYHFNGTIENETIQDLMKILKMTLPISYTVDNKTITISKI